MSGHATLHYRHSKILFCPSINWEAMGRALFGDNKALIVAEKIHVNHHVHIQGMTTLSDDHYDKCVTQWTQDHYLRKADPKARPVRHVRARTVDEGGFQYMCKEEEFRANILYKC